MKLSEHHSLLSPNLHLVSTKVKLLLLLKKVIIFKDCPGILTKIFLNNKDLTWDLGGQFETAHKVPDFVEINLTLCFFRFNFIRK